MPLFRRKRKPLADEQLSESEKLRRSMQELLVQLQEVAREVNASLDTKMIALEQLTRRAEEKIRELNELIEKASSTTTPDPVESAAETSILQLARSGLSELEIAQRTGIPRGEIELILALRRTPRAGQQ